MRLSALDRKIINCIQEDIPLTARPFAVLSQKIGIKERLLLERLRQLKDKGLICRFSGRINHKQLKFKSTLLGLRVPPKRVEEISGKLRNLSEVTHCFLRKGRYNIWTVVIYKNGALKKILKDMEKSLGKENILNLTTQKKFKLKTNLKI